LQQQRLVLDKCMMPLAPTSTARQFVYSSCSYEFYNVFRYWNHGGYFYNFLLWHCGIMCGLPGGCLCCWHLNSCHCQNIQVSHCMCSNDAGL